MKARLENCMCGSEMLMVSGWIVVVFVGIYCPISIQLRIVCYFLEVRKFNKTSVSFGSVLPTGEEL